MIKLISQSLNVIAIVILLINTSVTIANHYLSNNLYPYIKLTKTYFFALEMNVKANERTFVAITEAMPTKR